MEAPPMNQPTLIHLKEWERREVELAGPALETLHGIARDAGLTIDLATKGRLGITASSIVGAVSLPGIDLVIEPKLRAERVLFLLAYGRGLRLRDERAALREEVGLSRPSPPFSQQASKGSSDVPCSTDT